MNKFTRNLWFWTIAFLLTVHFATAIATTTEYQFFPTGSINEDQSLCMSSEVYEPISACQDYGSRVVNQCRLSCSTAEAYTTGVNYCTNYTYDALNQLISESVTNSHSYGYDDNGNRTALNGVSNQYLIGSNRILQYGSQAITTDAAGQITAIDGYTLQYNGDGRLYRILDTQGAELVRYGYLLIPTGENVVMGKLQPNALDRFQQNSAVSRYRSDCFQARPVEFFRGLKLPECRQPGTA